MLRQTLRTWCRQRIFNKAKKKAKQRERRTALEQPELVFLSSDFFFVKWISFESRAGIVGWRHETRSDWIQMSEVERNDTGGRLPAFNHRIARLSVFVSRAFRFDIPELFLEAKAMIVISSMHRSLLQFCAIDIDSREDFTQSWTFGLRVWGELAFKFYSFGFSCALKPCCASKTSNNWRVLVRLIARIMRLRSFRRKAFVCRPPRSTQMRTEVHRFLCLMFPDVESHDCRRLDNIKTAIGWH